MSRTDELNRILRAMLTSTPEVEAAALITEDALVIASALPQHIEELRVAGMTATMLNLGTRVAKDLERGTIEQILIKGAKGYVILVGAAEGTLLVVMTTHEAKLGLIFLDLKRAVQDISKII
ncbi:MAG: roadblock/LC7 domain-containing protein [Firmicutes bacterium]|nr:roadblock/LC7 domain-containing protein [Bacillota bacterium]